MSEPKIAATVPVVDTLKPDTYWWCSCGQSKNQPWCDGSHAGTEFTPKEVVIEEEKVYAMCTCKRTGTAPFCDGAHSTLPPQGE